MLRKIVIEMQIKKREMRLVATAIALIIQWPILIREWRGFWIKE